MKVGKCTLVGSKQVYVGLPCCICSERVWVIGVGVRGLPVPAALSPSPSLTHTCSDTPSALAFTVTRNLHKRRRETTTHPHYALLVMVNGSL